MSKIRKLLFRPKQFFSDAIIIRKNPAINKFKNNSYQKYIKDIKKQSTKLQLTGKPTAIFIGFADWKTFMVNYFPDHNVLFFGHSPRISEALIDTIACYPDVTVYAWSYKWPEYLQSYCREHNIRLVYVEDAFVRGIGLGVEKTKPLSLVFDKSAMHFDRETPSDLEKLLATYDFDSDPKLMKEAETFLQLLRERPITKYNRSKKTETDLENFLDLERPERVLVLGQVEDDMSIRCGMPHFMSGNDLVRTAAVENPSAQILYRLHPDLAVVSKPHYSNPGDVSDICQIMPQSATLHECFNVCTKVYTMTSLAGFEAVLAGKEVKVFGNPFYSGWGFTEDVYPLERRSRKLTPLQVLAGAYILYPRYYHPVSNAPIRAIDGIRLIAGLLDRSVPALAE